MPGDTVPFGSGPKLSGTLPAVLGTNENIQMLWLKNNYISGTLPPAWKELGNTLLELDLSRGMCSKCSLGSAQLGSGAASGCTWHPWRLWAPRHSQDEAWPLGAQPARRVLERAASKQKANDSTASDRFHCV